MTFTNVINFLSGQKADEKPTLPKPTGFAMVVIKVKYRDGTEGADRFSIDRLAIEGKCVEYAERRDILEFTVYEELFRHSKTDRAAGAHTGTARQPQQFEATAPAPVPAAGD